MRGFLKMNLLDVYMHANIIEIIDANFNLVKLLGFFWLKIFECTRKLFRAKIPPYIKEGLNVLSPSY